MPQVGPADDWLDRHGDVLYRYAIWRVRDAHTAEELVQETLLAALKGQAQFSGQSSQRTWLVGILRRKIVDHFRRAGREGSGDDALHLDQVLAQDFDSHGVWRAALGRWPDNPAQVLENREFWDALEECFAKLPPALGDVFALREMEELPGEEICKILSITPSNLWTQLHRGRILLRRCLELNWFGRSD